LKVWHNLFFVFLFYFLSFLCLSLTYSYCLPDLI
jgi:hypothetical protein